MKSWIYISIFFFYSVRLSPVSAQVTTASFKNLQWIVGTWTRTNPDKGQQGYEKWTQLSDTLLQGRGITFTGNDTTAIEKLKLTTRKNSVYYVADIAGNPEPVWYRLIEISQDGFICENLEYDFPKRIEYHLTGKKIKATISGNGKSIDYTFRLQR